MIGRQAIVSLRWLTGARLLGQTVSWCVTILVMRLLAPEDYGLMAIAMIIVGFTALFEEIGLGAAFVHKPKLEEGDLEQMLGALVALNLSLYAALYLAAQPIAVFFEEPRVELITQVLALQLPLAAFASVPQVVLKRRMAFKRKALVDFVAIISNSITTLVLAYRGYGVWSLVIGNLVTPAVQLIGATLAARFWCLPRFSLAGMRHMFGFGGIVTTDRVIWFFYTRIDDLVVGKLLGKEALGFYFAAKRLASMPMKMVGGAVNEVSFATYSRVQENRQRVRGLFLKGTRVASQISFPLFFLLSAVAPEAVRVLMGEKWESAILPLQLLTLSMPLRQLYTLVTPTLMGIGRPGIGVRNVLTASVLMTAAFFVGVQWGVVGVAAAWVLMFPVQFLIALWRSMPALGIGVLEYIEAIIPPALCSALMLLLVNTLRLPLDHAGLSDLTVLAVLLVTGGLSYVMLVLVFYRETLSELALLVSRR